MNIETIHKNLGKVTATMKQLAQQYKQAKGTPKEKPIVDKLKILTKKKNELMAQYHKEIDKIDADAELKIDEINFKDFFTEGTMNIEMPSSVEASWLKKYLDQNELDYDKGIGKGSGVTFRIQADAADKDTIIQALKKKRLKYKGV